MMRKVEAFALESSNYQVTFFDSEGMGKGEKQELSFKGRASMQTTPKSTLCIT
jgi:hypothetical protein